jgi:hypothetical protein
VPEDREIPLSRVGGRVERRRSRHPALWVAAVAGVASTALACSSDSESASDIASAEVRNRAERALARLEETVASPEGWRGRDLLDQIRPWLAAGTGVIIFDTKVDAEGPVTLHVAFHARGQSGGGLLYEDVVARLCVAMTVEPGPPPVAEMVDTRCPSRLPRDTGIGGNVDLTVSL